jgi:hypothetical protein
MFSDENSRYHPTDDHEDNQQTIDIINTTKDENIAIVFYVDRRYVTTVEFRLCFCGDIDDKFHTL